VRKLARTKIETREPRLGEPIPVIDDEHVRWSSGNEWQDVVVELHCIDALDSPEFCIPAHTVVLHPGARVKVEQKIRGRYRSYWLGAGDVEIFPAYLPLQIRHGRKDILILTLAPALVARVGAETPGARATLHEQPRLRDARIEQIAAMLAGEVQAGFPHGRLYGEALGTALAAHLAMRYSGAGPPRSRTGGLSPHRLRRVLEYIDANLTEDLRLDALAAVADLNPHRFAHNFKHEIGLAPHQYVIRERVERAKRLLRETEMTVAAVAYASGFGNPSRFTLWFRRITGMTPSAFRGDAP